MNIDLTPWAKRNLWPLSGGDMAVRPGLRTYAAGTIPQSGYELAGAFSVANGYTGEVWHYTVECADAANTLVCIYDESGTLIQRLSTGTDFKPETVSAAVTGDQIVIGMPGVPTVWGLVGGHIEIATSVASVNPATTALDVPQGMAVSWAGRVVIADASALYVSDAYSASDAPFAPRTFVAQNQQNPPGGAIYGLHVGAGGALVVCCDDGVYALPEDAAAAGQIALGYWRKLSDHQSTGYGRTCASGGRIYGLTRAGYRIVDEDGGAEFDLNEPAVPVVEKGRIAKPDFRTAARMVGGQLGPIVSLETREALHMHDVRRSVASWWTYSADENTTTGTYEIKPVGVLRSSDGWEMLACETGIICPFGNFDGDEDGTENAARVYGGLFGRTESPPELSPVVRHVTWANTSAGLSRVSVRATERTDATPQVGVIIGTDSWSSSSADLESPALDSRQYDFATRTDDLAFGFFCEHPLSRVGLMSGVSLKGPGKRRPVNSTAALAPSLSYGTPANGTETVAYTLAPTHGGAITSYSLTSGTLPTGLSLDSETGVISGTPSAAATYSGIVITATGPGGSTASASFSITIDASVSAWPGGAASYDDLYAMLVDAATYDAQAPTAGGTLTLNGASLGSYDLAIIEGNTTIGSGWDYTDYFTATEDSRAALVVIKGNLTVDSPEVFTPTVRKLFTGIYVTGDCAINGEISMTARGADHSSATGSNVAGAAIRLYTGSLLSTTNPEVPAAGGAGGSAIFNNKDPGDAGTGGGTGGGGSGMGSATANPGSGSAGTSFAGGGGGGATAGGATDGGSAATDGGPGGDGENNGVSRAVGGGTGNPGGAGLTGGSDGGDGLAGVLALFCDGALSGSGSVTSDGLDGGQASGTSERGGGGGGGGSVNVACGSGSIGTLTANGGAGGDAGSGGAESGGDGGVGTARQSTGL